MSAVHLTPAPDSPPRLFLVDGSGFIFRAYHSLPPLTTSNGTPAGAVYGFVNMVLKLVDNMKARPGKDAMAVIFDAGRKTFRNRMFEGYKANRPPAPEDLIPQFPLVRDATRALGLPAIELADYEADDLIATYTKEARKLGWEVLIISSDKDLMQLVTDCVLMYDAMKDRPIAAEQVTEKFGVVPSKVLDVLALMGDSSDNVPGVPGIGPKTAAELIGQYGDLDTLLSRASEIKQQKRRETLLANIDNARLSRDLIRLCEEVPLPQALESLTFNTPEAQPLIDFLQLHGFKSLVARAQQKFGGSPVGIVGGTKAAAIAPPVVSPTHTPAAIPTAPRKERNYTLVQDEVALAGWMELAKKEGIVAFDTETTGLDGMRADLIGFSLAVNPYEACYVPLNHVGKVEGVAPSQSNLFDAPATGAESVARLPGQLSVEMALKHLRPLLADPSVLKIGQNIKYDMLVMRRLGTAITPIEDTMLLSYVLGAGLHEHGMDALAERVLGEKTISYNEVTGTGRNRISFAQVALDKACEYAAEDADVTLRLYHALKPQLLAEKLVTVYETMERALVPVLERMEACGIKVDRARLTELSSYFATRLASLEEEVFKLAGHPFSLGSPKQLGEVLFEEMGLEGGRKGKTGAYSTDAGVLDELAAQGHEIAVKVLEWRQLAKLKSTYSDALVEQIDENTGRVHTSYAMAVTSTGRLSSTDPNLQNIPIRTEEGRKIRSAFIAEEGHVLLSADYSQIELRLLAHIADIPSLKEAFKRGEDIHAITASQMFGIPPEQVDANLRRSAKTINFGIIYGISAHGLASRLNISRSDAGDYIKRYFEQYPGISEYMERTKELAKTQGYVTTLFGRRCYLPGIRDKNANVRAFNERAAINAPLQGTAADIIKRAMVTIDRVIEEEKLPVRMLLQVHDELVFELPEGKAQALAPKLARLMEQAAHLSVPLVAETGIAKSWNEAH